MKKRMLTQIKNDLLEQKKHLKAKSYHEEVDGDGDDVDVIQAGILINVNSQLTLRDKEKINQIEKALSKIANKTFGTCEECEEPIGDKRLMANPYTLTCISCAEAIELEAKQSAQRKRS